MGTIRVGSVLRIQSGKECGHHEEMILKLENPQENHRKTTENHKKTMGKWMNMCVYPLVMTNITMERSTDPPLKFRGFFH